MLECTCAASDGPPRAVIVKMLEEKWGGVLEGALRMHGCVDVIGLLLVHAALAATPEGGEMIALQRLYQTRARRGDNYSACLPPLHKKLIHGVPSPRHEFE